MRHALPFLGILALSSCRPTVDIDAERESLLAADRAFAQATAEKGVDGWVETFAEDGAMLPAGRPLTRGREAIRELMAPAFGDPRFSLTWEPREAVVSAGGDFGYTIGRSERTLIGSDGTSRTTVGKYVTVWRKQPGGTWKVVVDAGTPDEPSQ